MFDLHCHIIPGIDDGAKTEVVSLEMLQISAENGTTAIVATPHVIVGQWLPPWEKIVTHCNLLRIHGEARGISIPIYPGAEVAISIEILKYIDSPGRYCLNSGCYMLVELPALEIPSFTDEFFFQLQTKGITPILAHPERHSTIAGNPELLLDWVQKGILLQINSGSILGKMGERAQKTAELLLANHLVHVIGSDAHNTRSRSTNLREAAKRIVELVGEEQAQQLLMENPMAIINSQELEELEEISVIRYPRKPGLVGALLKKIGLG